jgi:hypothetical protein
MEIRKSRETTKLDQLYENVYGAGAGTPAVDMLPGLLETARYQPAETPQEVSVPGFTDASDVAFDAMYVGGKRGPEWGAATEENPLGTISDAEVTHTVNEVMREGLYGPAGKTPPVINGEWY